MAGALAAAGLVTAGCGGSGGGGGGSSSGSYYEQVTKIGEGFATDLGSKTTAISTAIDPRSRIAAMSGVADLLAETEAAVRKLDPPGEASANQTKLLGEFDEAERVAGQFVAAARNNDAPALSSAASAFTDIANMIPTTFLDISLDEP
jgi:hypothetical protein